MLGSRLGPYEILSPLGAGGMGEVYKACDTRLGRFVAIKVLPRHAVADPDRRMRFEREARAVAALNHPHICTLYDVGRQEGIDFLVIEFLEGETLAERLRRGRLSIEHALAYAIQLADALDNAHRQGIVHRDLKPANVMLTKAGVKILDFGLAKLRPAAGALTGMSSATRSSPLTGEGAIVGTLHYMAPEQLEGKDVDHRTDLFVFGALLYEMLAGRRAFDGDSHAGIIGAILCTEPAPLTLEQPLAAPALDRLVRKCLAKDPDDRWQTARDLRDELQWVSETAGGTVSTPAAGPSRRPFRLRTAALLALGAAAAVVVLTQSRSTRPGIDLPLTRFTIAPPQGASLAGLTGPIMELSPDGTQLAFAGRDASGKNLLFIRRLDSVVPRTVDGASPDTPVFWSPDGRSIGFFSKEDQTLKQLDLAAGGPATTLTTAQDPRGAAWNKDGVILFNRSMGEALSLIPAAGGAVSRVTSLDASRKELGHYWPQFLPDDRHYIYFAKSERSEDSGVYAGLMGSRDRTRLLDSESRAIYVAPGYLLFTRSNVLMAQPFDAPTLQLKGDPVPVASDVAWTEMSGRAFISASQNGVLAYSTGAPRFTLRWFDRLGKEIPGKALDLDPGAAEWFALSPDGITALVHRVDPKIGRSDLWAADFVRGVVSRFTFSPEDDAVPVWSPDGKRAVFTRSRGSESELVLRALGGGSAEEVLVSGQRELQANDWSRDGRFVIYVQQDPQTRADLWIASLADRVPRPFLRTEFVEEGAQFSPDGRWVAYASDESGISEVYVRSFPDSERKWQVSNAGGFSPRWRGDGRELFYLGPKHKVMAVSVQPGREFVPTTPTTLFELPTFRHIPAAGAFAVTPEGGRFLASLQRDPDALSITVVLNWTAGLKK